MKNNDLGPTIVTLKAEVDFLGAELTAAKAEIARLRAGGCARDQGVTQYCAEAAAMAKDIDTLRGIADEYLQENERLRAALEVFACDCEGKAICLGNCMHRNARAALEGRT